MAQTYPGVGKHEASGRNPVSAGRPGPLARADTLAPPMAFVALITGASSGIGEAAARRLAREPGARLVLVARRRERLEQLARELGGATVVAVDLTEAEAPARVREVVQREHGELHLLVNNAGAAWRGTFAQTGWSGVERHLKLDFEAPVRLTEALLPLLRRTAAAESVVTTAAGAAVAIVNVASTASRVSRPGSGAYSAAKFALAGWSDALYSEEAEHGVHVGLVLPGFVATEGFPAAELLARARHPMAGLHAGARRGGDHAGRTRRASGAVRAALLLGRGGGADPGAAPGPACHRRRRAHHRHPAPGVRVRGRSPSQHRVPPVSAIKLRCRN